MYDTKVTCALVMKWVGGGSISCRSYQCMSMYARLPKNLCWALKSLAIDPFLDLFFHFRVVPGHSCRPWSLLRPPVPSWGPCSLLWPIWKERGRPLTRHTYVIRIPAAELGASSLDTLGQNTRRNRSSPLRYCR